MTGLRPSRVLSPCRGTHCGAGSLERHAAERHRTIKDADAAELFGKPFGCGSDCALFSVDCVNMWPLMDFDRVLGTTTSGSPA
ncbi:hypothetical protein [Streptomyces sp. BE133]|uniref:hypothetical protein n=1 Tax=Streptomyces sp. BE133 TaxID=3002523 RepID=UPI002E78DFE4|nr:hypothetical protein [Streptomyces sp. BE133]MEE1805832.1 hypothetical protein [Streptomyces sp. BE133]